MIGTSGEFSSTMTLSMPQADERGQQVLDRLDRACIARQPGGILDAAEVGDGGGNLEPPRSVRRKRMPKSAGAGLSESVTLLPE